MSKQENQQLVIEDLIITKDHAEAVKGGVDVPAYKIVIDPRSGSLD
jgi:hypothetical protein